MAKSTYNKIDFSTVGVERILTELGVDILSRRDGVNGPEVRSSCPHRSHDDGSPSCDINLITGNWCCLSHPNRRPGNGTGGFETFLTLWIEKHSPSGTRITRRDVLKTFMEKYPELTEHRYVAPTLVQRYVDHLGEMPDQIVTALKVRGVTMEMLKNANIGYDPDDERVMIPVYDTKGRIVNIRRYRPGASGLLKMRNLDGFASRSDLYRVEDLRHDTVWMCGGELKALVAGWYLNQLDIGAISSCSGEVNWHNEWLTHLRGKTIYLCMDVDAAGKFAAEKYATHLFAHTKSVHIVSLPLDLTIYRKGDINDWVWLMREEKRDLLAAFKSLIQDHSRQWTPPAEGAATTPAAYVEESLTAFSSRPPVAHQRNVCSVRFVTGLSADTFLLPSKVKFRCHRGIDDPGTDCTNCVVFKREEQIRATSDPGFSPNPMVPVEVELDFAKPDALEFIRARKTDDRMRKIALALGGVYPRCKAIQDYEIVDTTPVRQVEATDTGADHLQSRRHAILFNPPSTLDPAIAYKVDSRCALDPRDHRAVILVDSLRPADDTIDTFEPLREDEDLFDQFRPLDESADGIENQLIDISRWLADKVTHIYGRDDLNLIADLTYMSALELPSAFGQPHIGGWMNTLIIGDTGEGKSAVSKALARFYGSGDIVDCKAASMAGLLGGADISNGSRIVVWGAIPRADRHLLILEEVKGLDPKILMSLTETRSSGIAKLQRIASASTMARTRLLMVSNPRVNIGGLQSQHSLWEIVTELVGSDEDARRFDAVCFVNSDSRAEHIKSTLPDTLDSEAFKRLRLWTWSRTRSNITYADGVEKACHLEADKLAALHTEAPVVSRGTLNEKMLRIAVAIAARVASMSDYKTLLVTPAHVEVAGRILTRLYRRAQCGTRREIKIELLRQVFIRCNLCEDLEWLRATWARTRNIDDVGFQREFIPRTVEPGDIWRLLGRAGCVEMKPVSPGSSRQVRVWTREMVSILADPKHEAWAYLSGNLKIDGPF